MDENHPLSNWPRYPGGAAAGGVIAAASVLLFFAPALEPSFRAAAIGAVLLVVLRRGSRSRA